MGHKTNKLVLLTTQILLSAGWIMSIVCIVTHHWCYLDVDTMYSHVHENFGLYIMCQEDRIRCQMRESILGFDRRPWPHHPLFSKDFDAILLSFILAIVFTFLSVVVSLSLWRSLDHRKKWLTSSLVQLGFSISGAVCSVGGIIHFESIISRASLRHSYEHGRSAILAWCAVTCLIVGAVFNFLLVFLKPSRRRKTRRTTQRTNHDNKGYDSDSNGGVRSYAYYIGKDRGKYQPY